MVFRRVVVIAARLMIAVVAVGARYAALLIVAAMSLLLGVVSLAMTVVYAGSEVTAVKEGMKIQLVDLLVLVNGAYQAVGARLRPVVGALLPQALSLGCSNMETSVGFCNLGSLRKPLKYLIHSGHVCRWHGEDFMAVVVQDELVLEVPDPWWRSTSSCNLGM